MAAFDRGTKVTENETLSQLEQANNIISYLLCIDWEYSTEHDDALLESVISDAKAYSKEFLEVPK